MSLTDIQAALGAMAGAVSVLTFPIVCLSFARQSDALEFDLINQYRVRLSEVQRRYRDASERNDAGEYDKAALDLITVFEDLALVINRSTLLFRVRSYLTSELKSFLKYLLRDERFRRVVANNRDDEGSLDELAAFAKRNARFLGKSNVAPFEIKSRRRG